MAKSKTNNFKIAQKTNHPVERARSLIVAEEPFFGQILTNVEIFETRLLPTAAVGWNPAKTRYRLYYNPDFMSYLTCDQQKTVLYHEMLHIIFEHLSYRGSSNDKKAHKMWNIAFDLAINSHLMEAKFDLPRDIIIPSLAEWQQQEKLIYFGTRVVPQAIIECIKNKKDIPKEVTDIYGDIKVEEVEVEGKKITVVEPSYNKSVDFPSLPDKEKQILYKFVEKTTPELWELWEKTESAKKTTITVNDDGTLTSSDEYPEGIMVPCIPGYRKYENFPSFLASEVYFSLLKKKSEEEGGLSTPQYGDPEGGGFDKHDWDGNPSGKSELQDGDIVMKSPISGEFESAEGSNSDMSESIKKIESKRIAEKAMNESKKKGWGSTPQSLSQAVEIMLEPEVNWKSVFKYFVMKSKRGESFSTFRKTNRRYRNDVGEPYAPGRKIARTANILVAIDESGSVSNELMSEFFSELNNLSNLVTFTVLPFDTTVGEEFVWKKTKKYKDFERTKCGGTNFDAPTKYFNENKQFDALVVLTDMYAPKPISARGPRIWMCPNDTSVDVVDSVTDGREVVIRVK